jgi:peroxiredoxin
MAKDPHTAAPQSKKKSKRSEEPAAAATTTGINEQAARTPVPVQATAVQATAAPAASPARATTATSILAQIVVVGLAVLLVYGFVTVAKEGELRRVCAPTCVLKPEYHANLSSKEDETRAPMLAPNFTLKDMTGKAVALSDYRGKVVFLNFWMQSCAPCMEEFPDLVELAQVLATRKDVAVLSVSIDEGPDAVREKLTAVLNGLPPFPILFDPDSTIVRQVYGTSQFPETWIIDKEGRIRARFDGPRKWSAGAVTEFVDQVRAGEFCPLEIKLGKRSGLAQKQNMCASGG